jgi:hypothetical protein
MAAAENNSFSYGDVFVDLSRDVPRVVRLVDETAPADHDLGPGELRESPGDRTFDATRAACAVFDPGKGFKANVNLERMLTRPDFRAVGNWRSIDWRSPPAGWQPPTSIDELVSLATLGAVADSLASTATQPSGSSPSTTEETVDPAAAAGVREQRKPLAEPEQSTDAEPEVTEGSAPPAARISARDFADHYRRRIIVVASETPATETAVLANGARGAAVAPARTLRLLRVVALGKDGRHISVEPIVPPVSVDERVEVTSRDMKSRLTAEELEQKLDGRDIAVLSPRLGQATKTKIMELSEPFGQSIQDARDALLLPADERTWDPTRPHVVEVSDEVPFYEERANPHTVTPWVL